MHEVRVYLIDDHPVVRRALARVIGSEPGMTVVGQAGTAMEALRDARATAPDLLLVDLNLPDRDGIELLRALRTLLPLAKLVVLTCFEDELHVAEAMQAGADGYLAKSSRLEELLAGIQRAAAGETPLSPCISEALVRSMRTPVGEPATSLALLTRRERQVFRLLAGGFSTRDTASRLELNTKTVETFRVKIYKKLNCERVSDLTRIAIRMGLIQA